jgi:hypothetical protein
MLPVAVGISKGRCLAFQHLKGDFIFGSAMDQSPKRF